MKFLPYSSTEGALMVPGDSPVRSVADLAGKRLGVAGGPLDKNWLLLRARPARRTGATSSARRSRSSAHRRS